jgi:pimeloyl-ACP methyl ester carboxylesterase
MEQMSDPRPVGAVVRTPLEVVVPSALAGLDEHRMQGWVLVGGDAHAPGPVTVVYCLAGGGCTTAYFDLRVDGRSGYSMAEHLARRGVVVVALDHPGIGASAPAPDLFELTPDRVAAAHDLAARVVLDRLRTGTLAPGLAATSPAVFVGVGHSMGGMLVGVQQAQHETFDAIAVLGHGGDGLPAVLTDDELRAVRDAGASQVALTARVVELARLRFADRPPQRRSRARAAGPDIFFADDVPDDVRAAFVAQQTRLLYSCGLFSMVPSSTDRQKAVIGVPVFVAFGDEDLTDDRAGSAARYAACNDLTVFVLEGSSHCHNQATTRVVLWDRLANWIQSIR